MAKKKKGGLIDRLMLGSEKSEGYARASLPSNRWELFWDIFKGRFWKLVLINILVMLFCIPLFALFVIRYISISGYGTLYPFSQGFGVGYQAPTSMVGYAENIVFSVNSSIYLLLPIVAIIAALGISGGAYVVRNMVWTEGIFVANDFWKGIKQNFKQLCVIALVYSIIFYFTSMSTSFLDQLNALGRVANWLCVLLKVFTTIFLILYSVMTCHMITMSVTYDLKLRHLLKNSFLFSIGLAPQNILFGALCILPAGIGILMIKYLGGLGILLGAILILLFGLSIPLLIWTDYSQWAFDMFVNSKIPGAKKNRGIYEKVKENESETMRRYREQHELLPASAFGSRPIKPITDEELKIEELTEGFSRKDIERLNESKQRLYEDNERYIEEHKDDEQYVLARKLEDEKEIERQKRIEQAKKELKKRKNI